MLNQRNDCMVRRQIADCIPVANLPTTPIPDHNKQVEYLESKIKDLEAELRTQQQAAAQNVEVKDKKDKKKKKKRRKV